MSSLATLFVGRPVTRYCHRAVTPGADGGFCPAALAPKAVAYGWTLLVCGTGHPKPDRLFINRSAPKESVDSWPMASIILDAIGGMPAYR